MNIIILARCKSINGTHTLVRQYSRGFLERGHDVCFPRMDSSIDFLNSLDSRVKLISVFEVLFRKIKYDYVLCLTQDMYVVALFLKKFHSEINVFAGVYHPRQYIYRSLLQNKFWENLIDENDHFIFMNDSVKASHVDKYNKSKNFPKSKVVPLPFNIDNYFDLNDRIHAFNSNPLRIVSIGRAVGFKRYPIGVIKALQIIDTTKKITFEVYGEGEQLEFFKKIANENCNVDVKFMGDIDSSLIKIILKDCFLFVGMGYSIVEASNAGVPSIQAVESTDGELCYGLLSDNQGYEVGEKIPNKKLESTRNVMENILNLDINLYLEKAHLAHEKSKIFSQAAVCEELSVYFKNNKSFKSIGSLNSFFYLCIRFIEAIKNRLIKINPIDQK